MQHITNIGSTHFFELAPKYDDIISFDREEGLNYYWLPKDAGIDGSNYRVVDGELQFVFTTSTGDAGPRYVLGSITPNEPGYNVLAVEPMYPDDFIL